MTNSSETGWYVLYVRSRNEKKVNTGLQECELKSYLPLFKKTKRWGNRKRTILQPLFTSYVFVYIENRKDFIKALNVIGACFFIRFGKKLAKVKPKEIEAIKLLLESNYSEIILSMNNKREVVVHLSSLQTQLAATIPVTCLESNV